MTHISADVFSGRKSLVKEVTWQKTCNYDTLFGSSTRDRLCTTHISVDVQRITLNASCMTISGIRTDQLNIIAGFLLHHWLYKWFSQFRSCVSRSPSNILSVQTE